MVTVRKRIFALLAGAVVVLGIAGCSTRNADDPGAVNLQVENQMWSFQEQKTKDCMYEAGFEYVTRGAPASSGQQVAQSPYGLTLDQARVHGFGYVESAVQGVGDAPTYDANSTYRDSLTDEDKLKYDHALEGDPAGGSAGCRADAQDAAHKEYSDDIQTILGSRDSLEEVVTDPRYLKFEADWATCMGESGYPTTGFEEFHRGLVVKASQLVTISESASGDIVSSVNSANVDVALGAEINAAVTNVECLKPLEKEFNELIDAVVGRR